MNSPCFHYLFQHHHYHHHLYSFAEINSHLIQNIPPCWFFFHMFHIALTGSVSNSLIANSLKKWPNWVDNILSNIFFSNVWRIFFVCFKHLQLQQLEEVRKTTWLPLGTKSVTNKQPFICLDIDVWYKSTLSSYEAMPLTWLWLTSGKHRPGFGRMNHFLFNEVVSLFGKAVVLCWHISVDIGI